MRAAAARALRRTHGARPWVALLLALAACAAGGERGQELLERVRRGAPSAPFTLHGRSGQRTFRFACSEDGRWRLDEGELCLGLDGRGLWVREPGEPVRRLAFGSADELAARGLAWSGGVAALPGHDPRRRGPRELELVRRGGTGSDLVLLDDRGRPVELVLADGSAWSARRGTDGALLEGEERSADGRRRSFTVERVDPGATSLDPPTDARSAARIDPELPRTVPLRRTAAGRLLVEVALVDGPDLGWFLIDTGAVPTCIDDDVARELALGEAGTDEVLALGGPVRGGRVPGPPLRIGPLELPAHPWIAVDLSSLHDETGSDLVGILGLEFFLACQVEVAPHVDHLTLRPSTPAPPGAVEVLHDGRQPCTPAVVEGRPVWLRIDTGATDSLILNAPLVRELDLLHPTRPTRGATLEGLGGRQRVERTALRSGELAGVSLRGVEASLALARRGVLARTEPAGLVGMGLLGHRRLVLDLGAGWWRWPAL